MKKAAIGLILFILPSLVICQSLPKKVSENELTIGKSITIESAILGEHRDLNIYLPLGYATDSLKTYPVIYLLDGALDEDFIHITGIVQFGSFSWINMIPESIVVGIGNVDRKRDFTYPSKNKADQKDFPTSGKSENFIGFLEKELQPFIDTAFRTSENKTIIGQSLGGLLATEILFKKPDLFDNYIIVSPSLWWDDENLLDDEPRDYNSKKSVYIAVGKEGEVMERTAKELFNKLIKQNAENTRLFFEFLDDKTHGDALHSAVYNAFESLNPKLIYSLDDIKTMIDETHQNNFKFHNGIWKTTVKVLKNPLSGSKEWLEYTGTTTVSEINNGKANIVELDVEGATGKIEGTSLRLYNPKTKQWSLNYANMKSGNLEVPAIGGFKNGRGEFYNEDTYKGKKILVRFIISNITENAIHFEQAFSEDDGKTWELNWIADDVRLY